MLAVDVGVGGAISAAAVLVASITGAYVAIVNRRGAKAQISDDHFARALSGFRELLDAQDERIDDLEAITRELRAQVVTANEHVVTCERELAAAHRRLAELEANT